LQLSIDVGNIPVPERRYVADLVGLQRDDDVVRFMFGQASVVADRVRSLVIVSVFTDSIRNLIKSLGPFLPALREVIDRNAIRQGTLHTFRDEPPQTVALVANLVAITFSGREGELDFFHLGPNALRKVNSGNEVAVDPIVRIDVATSSVAALVARLVELEPELPPEIK
jgi:hypothetical protein